MLPPILCVALSNIYKVPQSKFLHSNGKFWNAILHYSKGSIRGSNYHHLSHGILFWWHVLGGYRISTLLTHSSVFISPSIQHFSSMQLCRNYLTPTISFVINGDKHDWTWSQSTLRLVTHIVEEYWWRWIMWINHSSISCELSVSNIMVITDLLGLLAFKSFWSQFDSCVIHISFTVWFYTIILS